MGYWNKFETYLNGCYGYKRDIPHWMKLAKEYAYVLETGNGSDLVTVVDYKRLHIMKILSHLSRFLGIYPYWKSIIQNYNLKWKDRDDDFALFEKININDMIAYLQKVIKSTPRNIANTFIFTTLTGLRLIEACKSIKLIKNGTKDYYSDELGILEHFRFKELFIHKTKKAFISIADQDLLEIARHSYEEYEGIKSTLRKIGLQCKLGYGRKVFGTYLKQAGIETEFIDILEGRVGSTVFAKYYYRPDFLEATNKITKILQKLEARILP